jgi:hypothetical protein
MYKLLVAAVVPLAVLAVVSPRAVAGPPPVVSSKQLLEPVTEKLIRLRLEGDPKRKLALVKELGPIRDARVTVALMEIVLKAQPEDALLLSASSLLFEYHIPQTDYVTARCWTVCRLWCEKNEGEVRRRAKQAP